ncbi:IS1193, transposase, ISL3 family [Streptococcus infantarius subsp. infantarius]|nr:IS1193, transposase, ISL3 family [Streptococcus infantarius subsp. infantarius]
MKQFEKKSLEYRVLKSYWKLIQKDSRKLSPNAFYSRTFRETLTPKECLDKIFKHVPQLEKYYNLYQLLLFYLQEQHTEQFLGLIQEVLPQLNHSFKTTLTTFIRYKKYITIAIELPYSNTKLEATNKLIKDINVILLVIGTLATLKNAFTSL